MQQPLLSRKKLIIITVGLLVLLVLFVIVLAIISKKDTNQFGKFIRIQNYSAKVKSLPSSVQDATESYLYNVVTLNNIPQDKASRVSDALIRDNSDIQTYNNNVYAGNYIVDMASIKQSYQVNYTYNRDPNVIYGNPIVVSCLPKEKLIYGEFNCKDIVSSQANKEDAILRYLPYQSYSFSIRPDATQGTRLVLVVNLTIASIDLKGDAVKAVASYKAEVVKWIQSKGLDPQNYTIQYNYDDAGNLINKSSNGD